MAIFQNLSAEDYAKLSLNIMPFNHTFSLEPTLFPLDSFVVDVKPILQVISRVLGKYNTYIIDHAFIGIFNLVMQPDVILDILAFWESSVNSQLLNFNITGCFRFR